MTAIPASCHKPGRAAGMAVIRSSPAQHLLGLLPHPGTGPD